MPRVNPLQASFNAGEFGPRMTSHVTFDRYQSAAACLENMIVLAQGGVARRPGSLFAWEVKNSAAVTRMLRFEFSNEQAYGIESGNLYFRFGRNQARIGVADTDAAITNGTFASNITDWDDRSTGSGAIAHDATNNRLNLAAGGTTAADIAWAEQDVTVGAGNQGNEHVLQFQVFGSAYDVIELRIGTTTTGNEVIDDLELGVGYHSIAFTPGATTFYVQFRSVSQSKSIGIDDVALIDNAPLELKTPYTTAQLFELKTAQTADIMYVTHPDHPVYRVERRGHASWSLVEVGFIDGPWLDKNTDTTKTLTASVAGPADGATITAVGHSPFASTDVGRLVRIRNTGDYGYAVITGYTSATVVTVDIQTAMPTGARSDWQLGAWSETTGYPAWVAFFEQRSIYGSTRGNTDGQPQTFWGSQSADIENLRPDSFESSAIETQDDDGFAFTLAADEVNVLLWGSGGDELVLGTVGGEWRVTSEGAVLTPADINVKRQTTFGSADIQPIRVSSAVLYVQRAKRKLREFVFNFNDNAFRSPDLTILAHHIGESGFTEIAYQQEPDSVVHCVRSDGVMAMLTYLREQNVIGWGRTIMGGSFGGGDAVIESVASIPGSASAGTENIDELWVIAKRTINGATKRYVEVFAPLFEGPNPDEYDDADAFDVAVLAAQKDAHYVDSGLEYDGVATTTITGLTHLEGETVKVMADGAVHSDQVVASGQITLDAEATKVRVGLGYRHKYRSLKLNFGARAGTPLGKTKRITGLTLAVMHSMKVKQGATLAELKEHDFREVSDEMDSAVPLFTGESFIEFAGDYDTDPRIVISDDAPVPFFLLAAAPEMGTNDIL